MCMACHEMAASTISINGSVRHEDSQDDSCVAQVDECSLKQAAAQRMLSCEVCRLLEQRREQEIAPRSVHSIISGRQKGGFSRGGLVI